MKFCLKNELNVIKIILGIWLLMKWNQFFLCESLFEQNKGFWGITVNTENFKGLLHMMKFKLTTLY